MTSLRIAIPSKGRLQEQCNSYFKNAGFEISRLGGDRGYTGRFEGFDGVEVSFLSASEIPRELATGNVHFGITGLDLVMENACGSVDHAHPLVPLGFGRANVVVAVPKAWFDVSCMEDLEYASSYFRSRYARKMRVATKYVYLASEFLDRHGITEYRIVESSGATEGSPEANLAEFIVDISTTGSTLEANNLKIPSDGTILKSESYLVASLKSQWNVKMLEKAQKFLDKIDADVRARSLYEVSCDLTLNSKQEKLLADEFDIKKLPAMDAHKTTIFAPVQHSDKLSEWFKEKGATYVLFRKLDYLRVEEKSSSINRLKDKLKIK